MARKTISVGFRIKFAAAVLIFYAIFCAALCEHFSQCYTNVKIFCWAIFKPSSLYPESIYDLGWWAY